MGDLTDQSIDFMCYLDYFKPAVAYIDFSKGGGHEIVACQNQPVNKNRAAGAGTTRAF